MVYDRFESLFETALDAVEEVYSMARTPKMSFGIDDGLLDIVALVGITCRHPVIRRRALSFMLSSGRVEGGRIGATGGIILKSIIEKEEDGLLQVRSSADIPAHRRLRIERGEQYASLRKIRLLLSRTPNDGPAVVEECWIHMPKDMNAVDPDTSLGEGMKEKLVPDVVFGCGSVSFLIEPTRQQYMTMARDDFCLPIPRI
ncbi:hypothetical protein B0A50_07064 [Salinomyces thailandicus]|uniref:Uncharacterized protein n=1 Tax=Salinomyces thailandicus TaxID=706561 RepID=A0A4U0TPQ4_9PEZI|nr:hypothetical protein B0A50_07064 [Salinomyces thailandica]